MRDKAVTLVAKTSRIGLWIPTSLLSEYPNGMLGGLLLLLCVLGLMYGLRGRQLKQLRRKYAWLETSQLELNHRVTNNLSVLVSLLQIQERRLTAIEARGALRQASERIQVITLLHHQLLKAKVGTTIEMSHYLQQLVDLLRETHLYGERRPLIFMDVDLIQLAVEPALGIGLIMNELVTNAYKYAFVQQEQPRLSILLKRVGGNMLCLIISDNGPGIPRGMDQVGNTSVGLELVKTMVRQLQGELAIENQAGARFYIRIPLITKLN